MPVSLLIRKTLRLPFLKTKLQAFSRKEKDISDADKASTSILNILYIEESLFVTD